MCTARQGGRDGSGDCRRRDSGLVMHTIPKKGQHDEIPACGTHFGMITDEAISSGGGDFAIPTHRFSNPVSP